MRRVLSDLQLHHKYRVHLQCVGVDSGTSTTKLTPSLLLFAYGRISICRMRNTEVECMSVMMLCSDSISLTRLIGDLAHPR